MLRHLTVAALGLAVCATPALAADSDAIKVHGHWKLEIINPDGSPAGTHEFENALVSAGKVGISALLAGERRKGLWTIFVDGVQRPCTNSQLSNPAFVCTTVEPPGSAIAGHRNNDLVVSRLSDVVRLRGSVIIDRDTEISTVSTGLGHCPINTSGPCNGTSGSAFTRRVLVGQDRIPVVQGQQVIITVNLSFE